MREKKEIKKINREIQKYGLNWRAQENEITRLTGEERKKMLGAESEEDEDDE